MEEIEALREELTTVDSSRAEGGDSSREAPEVRTMRAELERLTKTVGELKGQNKNLSEELEEVHEEGVRSRGDAAAVESKRLRERIADLEMALRREPKFMDVVNELKVAKVSLALANMEKEQALFMLQQHQAGSTGS